MYGRRVFAACAVVALVSAAWPVLAQRNNENNNKRQQSTRSPQEEQDAQALVQAVDTALLADLGVQVPAPGAPPSSTPPPAAPAPKPLTLGAPDQSKGDIPIKWESNHFVKGQDQTYIPFTLSIDKSSLAGGAAIYVRIVDADQAAAFGAMMSKPMVPPQGNNKGNQAAAPPRPTFAWERINFIDIPENGTISRAMQLAPGRYAVFIAVKEKTPASATAGKDDRKGNNRNAPPAAPVPAGKIGLLRHDLTVPTFSGSDLTTSSVILAKNVEQVQPSTDQESNPYLFGPIKITPSADGKFSKKDELSVLFWIYGAQAAETGKPDVTMEFSFYQKLPEAEKYFNRTAPQTLNAQSLPPEFSIAAGHQLLGSLSIQLASFPAGDYRLEIKVTDKPSGKSVTQNVAFTVLSV
jgi:hypothetical protein